MTNKNVKDHLIIYEETETQIFILTFIIHFCFLRMFYSPSLMTFAKHKIQGNELDHFNYCGIV